jgi:hypothetical protein
VPAERFKYGFLSRAPKIHRLETYVSIVKYRLLANVVNPLGEAPHYLPDDVAKIAPRAVAAPVDTDQ